jgi:hypothetical protein
MDIPITGEVLTGLLRLDSVDIIDGDVNLCGVRVQRCVDAQSGAW